MTDPVEVSPGLEEGRVHHNATHRSFLRNVLVGYAATFSSLLAGFLVTPILYRSLGVNGFGAYALVIAISGFALLADLGIGTSTLRRVAAAVAVNDDELLARAIVSSRLLLRRSAVVSTTVMFLVAALMPEYLNLPDAEEQAVRWSIVVMAVGQGVLLAWSTPTCVVIGHGRADLYATRSLVLGLITAAGQCVMALAGGGVVGVVFVVAASSGLSALIGVQLERRLLGRRLPTVTLKDGELRDLVREGVANFVISTAGIVAFASDAIVLSALAPLSAVSTYAVAARLPTLVRTLSGKIIDLLVPTYSHLASVRDRDGGSAQALMSVLARTTRLSTVLAVSGGLMTCASTQWVLDVWIGDVPDGAVVVVWILTLATVLQISGHAVFVLLTGLRRLRGLMKVSASTALLNVGLSVALTPSLGPAGPALGSLTCIVLLAVLVQPVLAARALESSARTMVKDLIVIPLAPALPAVGILVLGGVPTSSPWSLLIGLGAVIVYLIGVWLTMGRDDRRWFLGLRGRLQRRAPSTV